MKKFVKEKPHIFGLIVFFAVVFVCAFLFLPSLFTKNSIPSVTQVLRNEKGVVWGPLPQGLYAFSVASADTSVVKFTKGEIDPPDVHVGDTQKFMIEVSAPSGIKLVKAVITTDSKTQEVLLQNEGADVWRGSWVVEDTHDARYNTRFIAEDNEGNSDFFDIAWSDACGIGLSGNWSMQTNNGGNPCTISGVDGVDNGNIAIDASTLTVNGTFVWNSGKSITLSNGGKIVLGAGGKIQQGDLYMTDSDSDGYPSNSTQYTAPGAGLRRKSALTSASADCNDASATTWQYLTGYNDSDSDGYNSPSGTSVCSGASLPAARQNPGTDCDDGNASTFRSWYGYMDYDGDGVTGPYYDSVCGNNSNPGLPQSPGSDCSDFDWTVSSYITGYYDADNDGYGGSSSSQFCATSLPARYYSSATDCNDGLSAVHAYQTFYTDGDGDGYGRPFYYDGSYNRITETGTSLCAVTPPSGYSSNRSDCNDTNAGANVNNCLSGSLSGGTAQQGGTVSGQFTHSRSDLSGDPVAYPTITSSISGLPSGTTCYNYPNCGPSSYYVAAGGTSIHPVDFIIPASAAVGTYNISITISNNNIGFTGNSESHTYNTTLTVTSSCTDGYQDNDGDGYGAGSYGCYAGNVVSNNNDCNDSVYGQYIGTQRSRYQAQSKACGTACASETQTCQAGGTWSGTYTATSCSPSTRTAYSVSAQCPNCNGVSEGQTCQTSGAWSGTYTYTSCQNLTYFPPPVCIDSDGDGYGNSSNCLGSVCSVPAGYAADNTDCNDSVKGTHPGATETCNSVDDNCDGIVDNAAGSGVAGSACWTTWYRDADGDGYGTPNTTTQAASQPAGYVANSSDCYDSSALARPGGVWQSYARGDGSWDWNCDGVEQHKWCGQTYAIGNAWQTYTNAPYYTSGSSCTYGGTLSGYRSTTYTLTDICSVPCGQAIGPSCSSSYQYTNSSCSAGSGGQYYNVGGISQQDCQ